MLGIKLDDQDGYLVVVVVLSRSQLDEGRLLFVGREVEAAVAFPHMLELLVMIAA